MEKIYLILGKRIREERNKLRLSQERLAFKSKISINFLGQIERGTKHTTLTTATKIAEALDLTLSELLKEEKAKHFTEDIVSEKTLLYHFRERTTEEKNAFVNFLKSFPSFKSK
ncbi:MAG: helix-turn-helix transcriptional regulator [Syntrophales bacterium]|nr:helix-turn-helix transcriptional regulator [Syntrophales bacterium]